jgi:hypothetical protein
LPSLSSVTQGNNSAFLPADAPSEQAAQLAAPFGSTNLIPVPVVAAVSQRTLTAADVNWLTGLQHDLDQQAKSGGPGSDGPGGPGSPGGEGTEQDTESVAPRSREPAVAPVSPTPVS